MKGTYGSAVLPEELQILDWPVCNPESLQLKIIKLESIYGPVKNLFEKDTLNYRH